MCERDNKKCAHIYERILQSSTLKETAVFVKRQAESLSKRKKPAV